MAGVKATPDSSAQRWAQGLAGAGSKVREGVSAVQQAPGARAAAAVDRYLQGVQQSADKFRSNVAAVSLGDWQDAMINRGIPNMGTAAQQKQSKYQSAIADLLPHIAEVSRRVQSMPKGTLQDSINRQIAFTQGMAGYRKRS